METENTITIWSMINGEWFAQGDEPAGEVERTGYSFGDPDIVYAGGGQIWEDQE